MPASRFLHLCMQYNQLGKSTLRISEIGFGCMSLPPDDEKKSGLLIDRAVDAGINYFDTADLYNHGQNETVLGKSLKNKRNNVLIATKVGNQWKPDSSGWDWKPSKKYILEAVEKSLRRLQTNHIDLYQLHGGMREDPIDEVIEAFELLKHQGKIRYYGISSIRPDVIREYVARSGIVSVMVQYSLADRRPEETVLSLLQSNNIGVLCRGALAQGMLLNKPPKDYLGHAAKDLANAASIINELSSASLTPTLLAIRYVLQHPAVTAAVVGCSRLIQLKELINISGTGKISPIDISTLQNALPAKQYEQHR